MKGSTMTPEEMAQKVMLTQAGQIGQLQYDLTCSNVKLEAETARADAAEQKLAELSAESEAGESEGGEK